MTNEFLNKPSYFSILTADVRYDKSLSASEKIFYSEITCLCQADGFCYASNSYFTNLYNCDSRTIQRWLSNLSKRNYIKIEIDKKTNERKIFVVIKSNITIINENRKNERKEKQRTILSDFFSNVK
jgi:DNA-binding MarR family transcriptional regulator